MDKKISYVAVLSAAYANSVATGNPIYAAVQSQAAMYALAACMRIDTLRDEAVSLIEIQLNGKKLHEVAYTRALSACLYAVHDLIKEASK